MNKLKLLFLTIFRKILSPIFILALSEPSIRKGKENAFTLVKISKVNSSFGLSVNCQIPYQLIDVTIGDYTYISGNSVISFTDIGKFCSIGPNFLCGWGIHPLNGISTSPVF